MCAHIKAPSQTTLVANHRTKRDCSQQAFPVISYRKQQGGSAGSFVTPGRRYSSIAGRGYKSNTSTKLHMSGWLSVIRPPCYSWLVAACRRKKAFFFCFSFNKKRNLSKHLFSGRSHKKVVNVSPLKTSLSDDIKHRSAS